jgi:CheY-like chemotaxis protein
LPSPQYAVAAAERGDNASQFTFDEGLGTVYARAKSLGLDLSKQVKAGRITVQQVDPAELSPGEFTAVVRRSVEQHRSRLVIIDSLGVARRIRNALGSSVYLVALTGYGQPEDQQRALAAGFDVHLTKPVDFGVLQERLGDAGRDGQRRTSH